MNTLLNFTVTMAPFIDLGWIVHTIRPRRSDARDPQPGDLLYLYVGLHTPDRRLVHTTLCDSVTNMTILPTFGAMPQVLLGGKMLDAATVESLAQNNGFVDGETMINYYQFRYGLPFRGNLIGWIVRPSHLTIH